MWKKVFEHKIENYQVEVTKDFRKGNPIYSTMIGVFKHDKLLPFFNCEEMTNETFISLIDAARAFVIEDKKKEQEIEQKRLAQLSGKGNNKNPQANTGLSRFKQQKKSA